MARAKKKQQQDDAAVVETVTEETAVLHEDVAAMAEEVMVADVDVVTDEETAVVEADVSEETPVSAEPAEELPMTPEDVRLVEAILFATSSALTVGQIAERFPAERASLIPAVLDHLKEQYSSRGVSLVQRDSRWAFRTATDLGDQLRLEKEQPKKFTRSAMETMAVIAYHQPVTRAEIENIRGVTTSPGALDALMEAGWIKPGKRREVPGRPVTWLSTQGFLDHFGLEKLEDLPGMDELKAAGLLDKRPAIEAMPTADMFGDDENKQETAEDPQEVTDEDLMGKMEGKETVAAIEAAEDTGDDEELDDDDAEESDDEIEESEDADESDDDADDSDEDDETDDEESDDEESDDEDSDDEDDAEDSDEDDSDEDDEDADDEEDEDGDDEESDEDDEEGDE